MAKPRGDTQTNACRPPHTRRSAALTLQAAALLALAVGPRAWQIESLSLGHFDEGVFVSSAFGVWLHGPWHFPLAQALQAPPLLPWMMAGAFGAARTGSPLIALYLCAALGSATVAIYWAWLRRWYSPPLAAIAAALLATSDLHVAFSRMALTDVPLTFWFVASAYCLTRTIESLRAAGNGGAAPVARPHAYQSAAALGWCLATGLTAGAAWMTKYNGWMWLAIAGTTWLIVAARNGLLKHGGDHLHRANITPFAPPTVLLAIGAASLVSIACFAPWYFHVERTVDGGYHAVTANHLRYFGGIADWPSRAARLWLSLTAFRHFGWLATMSGMVAGLLWYCRGRSARAGSDGTKSGAGFLLTLLAGLVLLFATLALGADAVVTVLAAAAILPALVWGGWPEVLFAVWAGSFLIMTPFYHPYTRLLVPALPAEIALCVWLIAQALRPAASPLRAGLWRSAERNVRLAGRFFLGAACWGLFVAALVWRPFGWIPSGGAWQRWSGRASYRALGEAVRTAGLPANAVVLCQGPPAMTLYLDREWAPLEFLPFELWLPHVDRGRECFLAADFWGLYAENHQLARDSINKRIGCLTPMAVVPNDLNLMTLLDYLPAAEVAMHVSSDWPPKRIASPDGRDVTVPADLIERRADIIVLYRVDRDCVDQLRQR